MSNQISVIGSSKSGKRTFITKFSLDFSDVNNQHCKKIIIIFDISNDSIIDVVEWLKYQSKPEFKIVILGNKRDLVESETYRKYYQDLQSYTSSRSFKTDADCLQSSNVKYIAVSCKTNYNWLSAKKIITNHLGV